MDGILLDALLEAESRGILSEDVNNGAGDLQRSRQTSLRNPRPGSCLCKRSSPKWAPLTRCTAWEVVLLRQVQERPQVSPIIDCLPLLPFELRHKRGILHPHSPPPFKHLTPAQVSHLRSLLAIETFHAQWEGDSYISRL